MNRALPWRILVTLALAVVAASGPAFLASGGAPQNAAASTQAPAPTASVMGQVIDASTDQPVAGAVVTLGVSGRGGPQLVLTEGQGRFVFRNLAKGAVQLSASKPGWIDGAYGRLRPGGSPQLLDVGDGQHITDIKIPVWRTAALGGVVSDEGGDPVVGADVRAMRRAMVGGRRTLVPGGTATTDDRGMFRVGSLPPGDYVIVAPSIAQTAEHGILEAVGRTGNVTAAISQYMGALDMPVFARGLFIGDYIVSTQSGSPPAEVNGVLLMYPTTYYGGAQLSAQASVVRLAAGQDVAGINIAVRAVPTVRVSGTVGLGNIPRESVGVRLVPMAADPASAELDVAKTATNASGMFALLGVPSGQYVLRASTASPAANAAIDLARTQALFQAGLANQQQFDQAIQRATDTVWASVPVSVGDADVSNLVVQLREGLKVSGRLEFEGSAPRPAPDRLQAIPVSLEPVGPSDGTIGIGRVGTDAQFSADGLLPGRYFVRVGGAPMGWRLKSATSGGRDVADTALALDAASVTDVVITFTDRQTEISGTVTDGGAADGTATVIAFPVTSASWVDFGSNPRRLRTARANSHGAFTFTNLPAGEYFVAAIPEVDAADWADPTLLGALAPVASRIDLADGDRKTAAIRTTRVPR